MEKKLATMTAVILLAVVLCQPVQADPGGLAIAGKVSTLGLGGDVITNVAQNLNARVGVNWLSLNIDGKESDIEYTFGIDLLSFSGLLDWYIFKDSFHISGGLFYNQNEADMTAKLAGSYTIGGVEYPAGQIGTLSGKLTYDQELAPYIGIGWGNPITSKGRLSLMFDLGVLFTGSPNVDLSANATDPALQNQLNANVAKEEADINDSVKDFKFYPVVALSLFYRF
jgi:hypothetical protein